MLELASKYGYLVGFCGGIFAMVFYAFRMFVQVLSWFTDRTKKHQRNEWQAEFFDRNHGDYIRLNDRYVDLEERFSRLEAIIISLRKRSLKDKSSQ